MKKVLYIFLFLTLGLSATIFAQPPGPGGGGGVEPEPNCFPPPCVPIDGGLSWLLIAGTIYGGKKVFQLNKDEEKID